MKLHESAVDRGSDSRNGGDNAASVPGLRAPTVLVPQLVNSLCRVLLKTGGPLASFVHSVFSRKPNPDKQKGPSSRDVWPMAPPYPEVFRSAGGALTWRKRRMNMQVLTLDWLWLGRPK